jgi:hypothetical protein
MILIIILCTHVQSSTQMVVWVGIADSVIFTSVNWLDLFITLPFQDGKDGREEGCPQDQHLPLHSKDYLP